MKTFLSILATLLLGLVVGSAPASYIPMPTSMSGYRAMNIVREAYYVQTEKEDMVCIPVPRPPETDDDEKE